MGRDAVIGHVVASGEAPDGHLLVGRERAAHSVDGQVAIEAQQVRPDSVAEQQSIGVAGERPVIQVSGEPSRSQQVAAMRCSVIDDSIVPLRAEEA